MDDMQSHMAYDRTIAVFSPDGRLLQVEYARQAIKRGSTAVGLKTRDYVLLATVKTMHSKLSVDSSFKKMYKIDEHIAAVVSGLLADARYLINLARIKAQINRLTYGEEISVRRITNYIADNMHLVTQYAGVRPYGVGFLIAGIDKSGTRLLETDPSGSIMEWKARAIGRKAEKAEKILEHGYKDDMRLKDAVDLVVRSLVDSEKTKKKNVEITFIDSSGIKVMSPDELK